MDFKETYYQLDDLEICLDTLAEKQHIQFLSRFFVHCLVDSTDVTSPEMYAKIDKLVKIIDTAIDENDTVLGSKILDILGKMESENINDLVNDVLKLAK